MDEMLKFTSRAEFRTWLAEQCRTSGGVWLLFGKAGGPETVSANEALEEALCFGWIDGQMQSLDDKTYRKYFAQRREKSKWSEKNKTLTEKLEQQGVMTDYGREKIAEAKKNGQWDVPKAPGITDEQIEEVASLLQSYPAAYANFQAMAPSARKTYTRAYLDAKTDEGREKRLQWMVDRLGKNLKPM